MKSLKILAIATVSLLSLPFQSGAQNQMVWIHDDHVKPAMFAEYSKAAKELADACKKHNLQNADWMTIRLNNGTYRSVAAIDNMVKGSSGQALQNFNAMFGLPETLGLDAAPLFP